ncbi:hypothetical protein BLNAU_12247 [Blattamonas nauphoetae]|uniref:Uncharacterized protein n=1 Tax=Blattamonas nauphoetae TaxID=2049346 RepID=A0ABQ9XPQ2_9EUKA|nr:hypothetical protein BLNAU_12247 [Blattamonas nauphoetae]
MAELADSEPKRDVGNVWIPANHVPNLNFKLSRGARDYFLSSQVDYFNSYQGTHSKSYEHICHRQHVIGVLRFSAATSTLFQCVSAHEPPRTYYLFNTGLFEKAQFNDILFLIVLDPETSMCEVAEVFPEGKLQESLQAHKLPPMKAPVPRGTLNYQPHISVDPPLKDRFERKSIHKLFQKFVKRTTIRNDDQPPVGFAAKLRDFSDSEEWRQRINHSVEMGIQRIQRYPHESVPFLVTKSLHRPQLLPPSDPSKPDQQRKIEELQQSLPEYHTGILLPLCLFDPLGLPEFTLGVLVHSNLVVEPISFYTIEMSYSLARMLQPIDCAWLLRSLHRILEEFHPSSQKRDPQPQPSQPREREQLPPEPPKESPPKPANPETTVESNPQPVQQPPSVVQRLTQPPKRHPAQALSNPSQFKVGEIPSFGHEKRREEMRELEQQRLIQTTAHESRTEKKEKSTNETGSSKHERLPKEDIRKSRELMRLRHPDRGSRGHPRITDRQETKQRNGKAKQDHSYKGLRWLSCHARIQISSSEEQLFRESAMRDKLKEKQKDNRRKKQELSRIHLHAQKLPSEERKQQTRPSATNSPKEVKAEIPQVSPQKSEIHKDKPTPSSEQPHPSPSIDESQTQRKIQEQQKNQLKQSIVTDDDLKKLDSVAKEAFMYAWWLYLKHQWSYDLMAMGGLEKEEMMPPSTPGMTLEEQYKGCTVSIEDEYQAQLKLQFENKQTVNLNEKHSPYNTTFQNTGFGYPFPFIPVQHTYQNDMYGQMTNWDFNQHNMEMMNLQYEQMNPQFQVRTPMPIPNFPMQPLSTMDQYDQIPFQNHAFPQASPDMSDPHKLGMQLQPSGDHGRENLLGERDQYDQRNASPIHAPLIKTNPPVLQPNTDTLQRGDDDDSHYDKGQMGMKDGGTFGNPRTRILQPRGRDHNARNFRFNPDRSNDIPQPGDALLSTNDAMGTFNPMNDPNHYGHSRADQEHG